jgi:hypothetical protein
VIKLAIVFVVLITLPFSVAIVKKIWAQAGGREKE